MKAGQTDGMYRWIGRTLGAHLLTLTGLREVLRHFEIEHLPLRGEHLLFARQAGAIIESEEWRTACESRANKLDRDKLYLEALR